MTAKVLQLVNSAFFGIYSRVDSPERAVTLLGLDTIKVLVLSLELFSRIKASEEIFQIDRLWDHSLMVGKVAQDRNITMPEAEQAIWGATQSAVGSYLVGLWGFSGPIIEAIGFQNSMERYPGNIFTPALAVHVANVLYYRNRPEEILGRPLDIKMSLLERLGLQGEVVEWEGICAGIMQTET